MELKNINKVKISLAKKLINNIKNLNAKVDSHGNDVIEIEYTTYSDSKILECISEVQSEYDVNITEKDCEIVNENVTMYYVVD